MRRTPLSLINKYVLDVLAEKFGKDRALELTAAEVDEIRAEAYTLMSETMTELGPIEGLFEEAIEYVYDLKFVF